jgi:LysR family glycine cleavage system transcriptional activator
MAVARRDLPPLNAVRAFEAAARHLNFTRASEELFVTQAAISHQVKALEEWLGVPLFERQGRNVFLTPAGQAYFTEVRELLDALAQATTQARTADAAGPLTVSTLASFAANWLVPRLGNFATAHPDIEVRISANDTLVDFARDNVDMAVRYGNGEWRGVDVVPLMTEDVFPVCSPALLEGPTPLREPADLKHFNLLHDDMQINWSVWLEAAGVGDEVDGERGTRIDLSALIVDAAVGGQGVALARSALVAHHLAAGRLVKPFDVQLPSRYAYYIVYPPRSRALPRVQLFAAWLIEMAETAGMRPADLKAEAAASA